MATITNSNVVDATCRVTEVNLCDVTVRRSPRLSQSASADDISITVYHEGMKALVGTKPPRCFCLLSSKDTSKNPFFYGGCVYLADTEELYITSDLLQSTSSSQLPVILISKVKLTRDSGLGKIAAVEWLKLRPPVNMPMPAGVTNYKRGALFCAQGNTTPGTGGLYYMEIGKPPEPVVTNYYGRNFNSIQDVAVAKDGSLWFTDSPVGFERDIRPRPELPSHIYHFRPDTCELRVVADGPTRPGGIALSPDESTLYVTSTSSHLADAQKLGSGAASIYAFDVVSYAKSPFLTNKRTFSYAIHGTPVAVTCDETGNVYVGCGDGLEIWSPGGVLLGVVEVPGGVTAFAFGKTREIFICSGQRLWSLELGP